MPEQPTIDPIADESGPAYVALSAYAALGPGRSLEKLIAAWTRTGGESAPPTRRLNTLKTWSTRYAWQERVTQYDAELAALRLAEEQRRWTERAERFREESYQLATMGLERVRELLSQPHEGATLRDAAALMRVVIEVGRLALGEPTSHSRIDLKLPTPEELQAMTDEQLTALERRITGKE
jgi:hypothetical protein